MCVCNKTCALYRDISNFQDVVGAFTFSDLGEIRNIYFTSCSVFLVSYSKCEFLFKEQVGPTHVS